MSGLSWNISVSCAATFGRRYIETLRPDVFPGLEGFDEAAPCLTASSRNNFTEAVIARAVREAGASGLEHLAKGFDPVNGKMLGAGPWATLIDGDDLRRVVSDTQSLFEAWRLDPARLVTASRRDYAADDVLDALHCPATTVEEAIAAYDDCRARDDGDDLACVVALLQAHAAMAWQAANHGQALFHFIWLY